ncbi:Alpha/Beta hydrolase protein [Crassisporium funariophilum]|nr:Alpha/Beta hydrolase protein [Crassisporium funariophilum]
MMHAANYKTLTTSRGFVYSYYKGVPSQESLDDLEPNDPPLPPLLFLHGFPTSSRVWRHQVEYFNSRGFFVLVPDLLGFGGTSKPLDVDAYRSSLICRDIIEILDAEQLPQAIAIGHGLGSKTVSRLANFHSERFLAFAFLSVPYCAPKPVSSMDFTIWATKKMCGYELCGHTLFYSEDDASSLIESKLDSFFSAQFPADPKMWVTQVAPIGALRAWLERDDRTTIASYITSEDIDVWRSVFSREGIAPSLCYHKAIVTGVNADDDRSIHPEQYPINKPVFFGAANHDYISRAVLGIATVKYHCKNATVREFHDGHWLPMSSPAEVNAALFSWIMDVV